MQNSKMDLELQAIAGYIPPRNDKNVRPGDRMGLSATQVQQYIKRQKRVKGESYDLSAGDNTGLQVQLPGTARVWLGFVLFFTNLPDGALEDGKLSLIINNEVVIDETFVSFFGQDFTDEEYYFIPRPLSGQDDIQFAVRGATGKYTLNVANYYL